MKGWGMPLIPATQEVRQTKASLVYSEFQESQRNPVLKSPLLASLDTWFTHGVTDKTFIYII